MRNKSVKNIPVKNNKVSKKSKNISDLLKTVGVTVALSTSAIAVIPYVYDNSLNIVQASSYTGTVTGVDEGGLRVRSSATTENTSNIITKVYEGDTFDVLDTVYNGSMKWYKIGFYYNGQYTNGYVAADYVTVKENTSSDDNSDNNNNSGNNNSGNNSDNNNDYDYSEDFETMLNEQGFPESYKDGLRQIHSQYPNWIFTAEHIDRDWDDIIANENVLGRSLVYGYAKDSWKSKAEGAYNSATGEYTVFDSGGWVQASSELVEYAIDPRNFLNATNVFMFEDLAFSGKIQTEEGVQNVIAGTFMENSTHTLNFDGMDFNYASGLFYAGSVTGVSPYHLATRIIQEQGNSGQGLSISGTYAGYEGLFNYYNQGAYKSGSISAVENGLIYASKNDPSTYRAWNTRMKSIIGGAKILGANYINRGQNTLYYEKFDMITPYSHQYMTFILAPRQESVTASKAYSDSVKQSTALRFLIPVYNNMPDTACPPPDDDNNNSGNDNNNNNNNNSGDNNNSDNNNGNDNDNSNTGDDVVVKFTGMKLDSNNVWRYYVDDEIDYTYTGMAENEYGWWYFNNGNLDMTYTGMAYNDYGYWYFSDGTIDTTYTGLAFDKTGIWSFENGVLISAYTGMLLDRGTWLYVNDGNIDYNYTGMALNEYGWWYFSKGNIDLGYTGMALNDYGWWYFSNGVLDTAYTGEAVNEYGHWYYIDGRIAVDYTGMLLDGEDWKYVVGGYIDYDYTGMALNEYGWWYFNDGVLDTSYTGMALNEYGWWYFNDGVLDTSYTGEAVNEYGHWYYVDGRIAADYTGMLLDGEDWKYVVGGYIDYNYTGMALNDYGWWYFNDGVLDTSYTGMALNDYGWWYFNNGVLDTSYTGVATNEYGQWYFVNGQIDFNHKW